MRDSQEESVAGLQKGDDDSDPIAGSFAQAFNQLGDGLHDTGQLAVDGTAIAVQATGKFVGGLLDGDAFFPDNESRLARATELAVDISASAYLIAHQTESIKAALEDVNLTILDVFRAVGVALSSLAQPSEVNYHQSAYQVTMAIAPLFTVVAVNTAMTYGSVAVETISGEISAEVAGEALGATSLGLGGAAVLMAAIIAIVGVIEGEEKRRKLRAAIQERFALRFRFKLAEAYATELTNVLAGLSSAIKIARSMAFDPMSLTVYVENKIALAKSTLGAIDTSAMAPRLQVIDTERGSWTYEDEGD